MIIENLKIFSIRSFPFGVGFLVFVDGLTIFYPEIRGGWSRDTWVAYTKEINYIHQHVKQLDMVFLSLPRGDNRERGESFKRALYVIENLKPKEVFFSYGESSEFSKEEFMKEATKNASRKNERFQTTFHFTKRSGDRFIVKK